MMFCGVNHLALVSSNMDHTVRFYTQVLGLRLHPSLNRSGCVGRSGSGASCRCVAAHYAINMQ